MSNSQAKTTGPIGIDDRKRIDAICDRFENAWFDDKAGPPDLTDYLGEFSGTIRGALLRELIGLDLDFRRRAGEEPRAETYRDRFPENLGAIAAAFAKTEGLSSRKHDDILKTPVEMGAIATAALGAAGYQILGELGRGGMGVVYRAFQQALNRNVALKVIRSGDFASDRERRRFQNEAEAVAQFDHPNIVPIYEVGQSQGLSYFCMKLVVGAGLDKKIAGFLDNPRAAAKLVATVAEAIQHAHERGILHRDLKPANILVDDHGAPHVTDFGLAWRFDTSAELSQAGAIVGTPSYMSPEQASGLKDSYTTATDVYGLGAILYALLAGHAPHIGSSVIDTLDKVRQETPEAPSRFNRGVPRDLEIIAVKCLEKNPRHRYASARELADDLNRWLEHKPISARRVGTLTRAFMWCRRHPLAASLAAMLTLAIVGGTAGVTWKWLEADRQRVKTAKLNTFWTGKLLSAASRGQGVTVKKLLDYAAARIKGDLGDQPEEEEVIRETVGEAYLALEDFPEAETHLRAALSLDTKLYGANAAKTLHVGNLLNAVLDRSARSAVAEPAARKNWETSLATQGPLHPTTLEAGHNLGLIVWHIGKPKEAEALLRQVLAGRRKILIEDHPDTLKTINALGLLLQERGDHDEAEKLANEYEHGVRCTRPNDPENISALLNLAALRQSQGRHEEAHQRLVQATRLSESLLGPEHPTTRSLSGRLAELKDSQNHSQKKNE